MTDRSDTTLHRDVPDADTAPQQDQRRRQLTSDVLLQGRRMVEITHNGEVYRLQATRLGKLILTK